MAKKIVILGGCGFLGANLAARLIADDEDVSIFDHPAADTRNLSNILTRVNLIRGDFTNIEDLEMAVKDQDIVFHLISTTNAKTSTEHPEFDIATNLLPTVRLLELATKHGISRIIFPSSGGTVYGPTSCPKIPEGHATDPICAYGIQKLAIEKYLALFNHAHGLDYRVLRLSNPYGPAQWGSQNQGLIGIFCQRIIQNEPLEVWGDGRIVRDYVYVDDAVDAFIKAMSVQSAHRLFNIGSGIGTSINEIIDTLAQVSARSVEVNYKSGRAIDIPTNVLDPSLAKNELGWNSTVGLKEGIERTFDWFLDNQVRETTMPLLSGLVE